jgi:hypothetical protein
MTTSFWKNAGASLPAAVRQRYAADFEAAERFERLLDLGIDACGFLRRALAKSFQAVAQGLRTAARVLDAAARHLSLTQ